LELTCHCTVGVGKPLACAVNVAVVPATTVLLEGLVVTVGAVLTVSVAAADVAAVDVSELTMLVNTARYCFPLSFAVAEKL
jgi:hypothetical protein